MQKKSVNYLFILFIISTSISFIAGCRNPIELNSEWRDFEITIDGIDDEWGRITIYAKKAKMSLTLLNDENYMYIRLSSRDRQVHTQVLGMGLTVWFDPDGGKSKTFGVHFPLGMQAQEHAPMMVRNREGDPEENLKKMLEESMDEMEIFGPGKEVCRRISLRAAETQGIKAKMGFSKGNLVYELRVPLVQDEDHLFTTGLNAAEIDTNKTIGIGFETPELHIEEMRKQMEDEGMGMPSEGQPPGGGRMPGGVPGGGPPGGTGKPDRLSLWTKVKLAPEPSFQE